MCVEDMGWNMISDLTLRRVPCSFFFIILFKDFSFLSFEMNGESSKEVPLLKYLGHVIEGLSADMEDDLDIMRQCGSTRLAPSGNCIYLPIMRFVCYSHYRVIVMQTACLLLRYELSCTCQETYNFYKRVKASQCCIVQSICESDIWWKYLIRAYWNQLSCVPNAGLCLGRATEACSQYVDIFIIMLFLRFLLCCDT